MREFCDWIHQRRHDNAYRSQNERKDKPLSGSHVFGVGNFPLIKMYP